MHILQALADIAAAAVADIGNAAVFRCCYTGMEHYYERKGPFL